MNQAVANVGRMARAVYPAIGPLADAPAAAQVESPMLIVLTSALVNKKAKRNSFQEKTRQKIIVIAAPGFIKGNMIFRRIAIRP